MVDPCAEPARAAASAQNTTKFSNKDHLCSLQAKKSQLMGSSPSPLPSGEPSLPCRAAAELGALPPQLCWGTVPCITTELNHGLAATLSTHRRDLAIPGAINRARLLSWAPRRAGGVRESKANSEGGEGLSLPKERSGNNLSGSRNRALPSPHLSLPLLSQEGTMDKEQQCPQGDVPLLLPSQPHGALGAPALWEQQERHWEGVNVGWTVVGAALPAWTLTSAPGCEPGAVRTCKDLVWEWGRRAELWVQCWRWSTSVGMKIQTEGVL